MKQLLTISDKDLQESKDDDDVKFLLLLKKMKDFLNIHPQHPQPQQG